MEMGHPIVQKIWRLLRGDIPSEYLAAANFVAPAGSEKSVSKAAELRTLGSTSYSLGDFDEALKYYNDSVATAPADTEQLALAYSDRSSVFLCRKLCEECLLDVNRALAGPLSLEAREIMLQRKTIAWSELRDQNNKRAGMREGILYMKRSCRQEATLTAYERRLCYISKVGFDDVDLVIDHSQLDDLLWNAELDDTSHENVSPKIVLKYDAQLGPHLVAIDDIEPGEPLWLEDMYSFSMLEVTKWEYCSYCHFRCEALIPCPGCTAEMYCSTGCREKAYISYHRIECEILPLWVDADKTDRELRVLCLRTFLWYTKQGSDLANLMNNSVVCKTLDGPFNFANLQFSPENYPVLLANVVSSLRYSDDEEERCHETVLRETVAILVSLRYAQFFGGYDGSTQCSGEYSSSELECFATALLVYQMSLTWSRSFHVKYYLVDTPSASLQGNPECIGRGLSTLQCFTHHSCEPNIGTVTNMRRMLTYSLRSIKAGEQIRRVHHANYAGLPRDRRRFLHNVYGLPSECTCKACVEDWPEYEELASRMETYRTRDEETLLKIQTMRERLDKGEFSEENLREVIEFSKTIREYVEEPSFTIYLCEDYIEGVMFVKGNLFVGS